MPITKISVFLLVVSLVSLTQAAGLLLSPQDYDQQRMGEAVDGRIIIPTNQVLSPIGKQVAFTGRPTDLALSPDGRWIAVLSRYDVLIISTETGEIISRADHKSGSFNGIVFSPDGDRLFASNVYGRIGVFAVSEQGELTVNAAIKLPAKRGSSGLPSGLAIDSAGTSLWVVLNMNNTLAEIGLFDQKLIREIPVGNAPYGVVLVGDKAYVSNWAGRHPGADDPTGPSGKATRVRVDSVRNIASEGTVSVIDLVSGTEIDQIQVGLHPSGMAVTPDHRFVCVANANSDSISVIEIATDKIVETISTRPDPKLLFGSSPNAIAFSADGNTMYVSNGTNNCIAVIEFRPSQSRLTGCLPTGWYPAGIVVDAARKSIYVANIKGVGSRNLDWKGKRKVKGKQVLGFNSHDYLGTVSMIKLPTADELLSHTRNVLENNRLNIAINALAPARQGIAPRPVPQRHGEPSVFKHVLYIIKENRTYDQVLGDIERAEGDESLCIFGAEVTPNHHKLVDEFVLLDNFYCSGTLSADGHQWTNEAYVTDYIEKSYGSWPRAVRSYPFNGGDALAYAPSGFLWDNVLSHGKTLRVYGEFVGATVRWKDRKKTRKPTFMQCYRDFIDKKDQIEVKATARIETIAPHICPTSIGFPGIVPDIHRAQQFIDELKQFEIEGTLPNFMVMLLPNDHTTGTRPGMPTPEAAVADNDLALGRVVEAISHSKFWAETCIFVVQDDPSAGFDHIDGHRTVAMVISPYTRRHLLDSTNYNQTSMIRTMELILGLPPMNQFDSTATAMTSCFTETPKLAPYTAVPNRIPLDRLNVKLSEITDPQQKHWAQVSIEMPLDEIDEADEDTINRVLWHATRGRDDTYPAWAIGPPEIDDDE